MGLSIGSAFSTPWAIGTISGTIAPFRFSFMELGIDYGMISGNPDAEKYYSLYPFIHYSLFIPFRKSGGWYAGVGGGYMLGEYTFPEEIIQVNIIAFNATTGVNIGNFLDISYTLRTNFNLVNHKIAVGYTFRFR